MSTKDKTARTPSEFELWAQRAEYTPQVVPEFQGNPYIEALGPSFSGPDLIAKLGVYPKYDPALRLLADHERLNLIQTSLRFFDPMPRHIGLALQVGTMIRMGYVGRNPVDPSFYRNIQERAAFIQAQKELKFRFCPTMLASGFGIIGLPGTGKSAAIHNCLRLLPEMINHSSYQGRRFNRQQLVYLHVQMPHDATISGLCRNVFNAVDKKFGTNFAKQYGRKDRDTKNEMIGGLARVASLLGIGVFVFDELQNLDVARSGGLDLMLQFFVQLINELGIPIIFVGTDKARSYLTKALHQIRRIQGQGDFIWERLVEGNENSTWGSFVESLCRYQYTRHSMQADNTFCHVLYDQSQGIIDYALKLFMLAQTEAILNGDEVITPDLIMQVAAQRLRLAQPVLEVLRTKNIKKLEKLKVEDLMTIDLEDYWEEAQQRLLEKQMEEANQSRRVGAGDEAAHHQGNRPIAAGPLDQDDIPASPTTPSLPSLIDPASIPAIVANGAASGFAAYAALKAAGTTIQPNEYSAGE